MRILAVLGHHLQNSPKVSSSRLDKALDLYNDSKEKPIIIVRDALDVLPIEKKIRAAELILYLREANIVGYRHEFGGWLRGGKG